MKRKNFAVINFLIHFFIWVIATILIVTKVQIVAIDLIFHILVGFFGVITGRTLGQLFGYKTNTTLYPFYVEMELIWNLVRGKDLCMVLEKWKNSEINKF